MNNVIERSAPVARRVRAFFAPVARDTGTPTLWDPAGIAGFNVDAPPAPWIDLGWCQGFARSSGTKIAALRTGAPAIASGQVRTEVEAGVSLEFDSWGKLQLALSAGVQQINVLTATSALIDGSTATSLTLDPAATGFAAGDLVVVDVDYAGTTGFVGAGVSGGYVKSAASVGYDPDYVRRVSLNVARITAVARGVLTLAEPLLAGVPGAGMKVSKVAAFCDREGGSFFQEWSALFVLDGTQGDRVVFHYPRLQATAGAAETKDAVAAGLDRFRLSGRFRALPVRDAGDGEMVLCYRSYLPAAMRAV